MLNNGNNTFESLLFPDNGQTDRGTESIVLGDLDRNAFIDIVVGNVEESNQVIQNSGDYTFSVTIDLPGGTKKKESLALADTDGDGIIDIVIGNDDESNQIPRQHEDTCNCYCRS